MSDRTKASFARIIRGSLPGVDFQALYPAKVVSQNSDGTLELRPDLEKLPGLSNVPYRGLPGITVKVASGARVLLGFENGSPTQPIVTLWETHSLLELLAEAASKLVLSSPSVKLGADAAADAVVKGTTYRAAEAASNALVIAALTANAAAMAAIAAAIDTIAHVTALGPAAATAAAAAATAATAAATAVGNFEGGAASYLSTVTKTA